MSNDELIRSHGPIFADIVNRVTYYERKVWIQIGVTVLAFAGLFSLYGHLSLFQSVVVGVLSNLVTMLGTGELLEAPHEDIRKTLSLQRYRRYFNRNLRQFQRLQVPAAMESGVIPLKICPQANGC